MPERIRFQLDEHIPSAVARALRRRGIDVLTATEAGLLGADDRAHLASAHAAGRVVVTQDADFLALHGAGVPHSGIIYCPPLRHPLRRLIAWLILIWEVLEPEEMAGRVHYV